MEKNIKKYVLLIFQKHLITKKIFKKQKKCSLSIFDVKGSFLSNIKSLPWN